MTVSPPPTDTDRLRRPVTADRDCLAEIEAALAKATPGPWQYDPSEGDTVWDSDEDRPSIVALTRDPYGNCEADAALIVAAVNALPWLLATVREQADAIERARALAEEFAAAPRGELMPVRYAARELRAVLPADHGQEG